MLNHGVNVSEQSTSVQTPVVATSGIPFVVGVAPIHAAESPAKTNVPVLITSWDEAVEKFGYCSDWEKYTLCEFMYSHFKLFNLSPVIFVNCTQGTESSVSEEINVENHKIYLPFEAVDDSIAITSNDGTTLTRGVDFGTYYDDEHLVIELKKTSTAYNCTQVKADYKGVTVQASEETVAYAFSTVNECITSLGITPDLLCAPGYSHLSTVAATMATVASNISGLFKAKAICDSSSSSGVVGYKTDNNMVDSEQIVCWPMLTLGDKKFHLSTQLAALMAQVDAKNGGVPCESPSNKSLQCDGLCDEMGVSVTNTLENAGLLNDNGIVTAINFVNGFVAWGNYTACYPSSTDVKDYFIPVSRSFKWVENTLIQTFWSKIDNPLNRVLIDSVVESCNIWLNGLVGKGYFLGARVEVLESENTLTDLMAGKITFHVYITPPSPAQRIDWIVEYDANYVTQALS